MKKKTLISSLKASSSTFREQGDQLRTALHRDHIRPFLDKVQETIWDDKRRNELNSFNPNVEATVEEQWVDIGTVAATSSTILAVGGAFISPALSLLSIPGLLIGSAPVYKSAYDTWKEEGKFNNDFLASLIQTALVVNGKLVLGNLTPLAYFSSKNFNLMARKRFESSLAGILTAQENRSVTVILPIEDGEPLELTKGLDELAENEIVVVYAGEVIPVDGVIVDGISAIDERILTGESQPVEKGVGETVYAATLVLSGKILIQVDSSGADTIIAQIEEILNSTFYYTSQRELWAQKLTDSLAVPTLLTGAAVMPFLGISGAMAVVDSNPLYRLSIAGNSSLLNFLNITSQENILVKDGRVLEMLENVDTVIFDKTGTLTEDTLQIGRIYTFNEFSEDDVLFYAALAEQKQSHPIAQAIIAESTSRQLPLLPIDTVEYRLGMGLFLQWEDKTIRVGSPRFIVSEEIAIPAKIESAVETSRLQGITLILVAVDEQVIGAIELSTVVRPEAADLVATLQGYEQIKSVMIVSGDHEAPTKRLAEEIGITEYHASTLPEGKASLIQKLQQEGHTVCFVGDGLNDSIALKQADVSISLQGASSLATSTAQVILLDDNLESIKTLFNLAQQFDDNQKVTMGLVLGSSSLCLASVLLWQVKLAQAVVITTSGFLIAIGVSFKPWVKYRREIWAGEDVINLENTVRLIEA